MQERQKLLEQPFDPIAVTARVLAMLSRVLPSKPEDWEGWPMHVRSITRRKVEGVTHAYIDGVDLIEAAKTDQNAWDEVVRFAAPYVERVRIPRHPATQPTNIRPPIPRSSGQAVGAQRRRFALLA